MNFKISLYILLVVVVFLAGGYFGSKFFQNNLLDFAYDSILKNYDGQVDSSSLKKSALEGMLKSLSDPNGVYADKDDYAKFNQTEEIYKIETKNLGQGIIFIRLDQFPLNLIDQIKNIPEIKSGQIKGIIIDLRNNLGGDFETSVLLADEFLKDGIIVKEEIKGYPAKTYTADSKGGLVDLSLVIIQGKETSSAAEIFSAAIKENNRGKIVGEKSYGKGTEGQWFKLSDNSAIHFQVGKWFTPNGNWLNKKGLEPDINIFDEAKTSVDEVVQKAFEVINKVN